MKEKEILNYSIRNKALMGLCSVVEHKLNKALKESEKDTFDNWDVRQTYLMGYRKALRELLLLKPDK
jgi:hypothetical protein